MEILLLGDSTQKSMLVDSGGVAVYQYGPEAILRGLLGPEHTVVNKAVGGSTLVDALSSNAYPEGTLGQMLSNSNADIVVCNWGINDAYLPGNNPTVHRQRWVSVVNTILSHGKTPVVETPNPISLYHTNILTNLVASSRYIPGAHLVDVHAQITWLYPNWRSHLPDGVHPNKVLYSYIGVILYDGIKHLVSGKR